MRSDCLTEKTKWVAAFKMDCNWSCSWPEIPARTVFRVSTTPGNPGNLLEFENPPGNPGNLLEFKWSSWKFLCNDYCMVNGFTT